MFGTKHAGQDSKTEFDPAMAKFNLVVPSRNCLDNFFPQYVMNKKEMKPGINKGILKLIAGRKSMFITLSHLMAKNCSELGVYRSFKS